MGYQQLAQPASESFADRVANIEADLLVKETVSLHGTRNYAGGFVPATLTTGTDTAGVIGQVQISEVRVVGNALLTGVSFLLGSVGGTDKAIVFLFDSTGAVLATSSLLGVTAGTLATFQRIPFTAQYQAGPGLYFVGVQLNGTTAKTRTQAAGDHLTGTAAQTFGTPVAITPPTTFTAGAGPIAMTY